MSGDRGELCLLNPLSKSAIESATSETRAARETRVNIFIPKTMSDSIIPTFLGYKRHKYPLLFKIGHFLEFT